ncbi:MAG: acyltransferase [Pseudomonadaceae bacterium]|nr:acyltransferase [Pseudomonadaceae bacterium]
MNLKSRIFNKWRVAAGNKVTLAKNVRMKKCTITIKGQGNHLHIAEHSILRGVNLEIVGENCLLEIGSSSILGHDCYLSVKERDTKLILGSQVNLSRNVRILCADGHDIVKDKVRINIAQDIKIGNKVWLADSAVVLKGVTIGNDAIVGIQAVVTQDVPAGCIAAGNPARLVKEGVSNRWEHSW